MTVTVRYIGDEPREVSILPHGTLKRVEPDDTFEVPDKWAASYGCQPHFYDVPGFGAEDTSTPIDPDLPDPDLDDPSNPNPDPDPKTATGTTKKAGN